MSIESIKVQRIAGADQSRDLHKNERWFMAAFLNEAVTIIFCFRSTSQFIVLPVSAVLNEIVKFATVIVIILQSD